MSEGPAAKKQRTHPHYELLYHPGLPGRGEFIRLPLEAAGVQYTDAANSSSEGTSKVYATLKSPPQGNPPIFAPPALLVPSAHPTDPSSPLLLHQTPTILAYLGPRLSLAGPSEAHHSWTHQIACTALDLNNEVHDTHHPVAVSAYYEEQKEEALRKSKDLRENRLPKFFSYFERILEGNEQGSGKYLVGEGLTYADTTVWQVVDGLFFAFPKEMAAIEKSGKFPLLLGKLYPGIKEEERLKEYYASDRRKPYSMGIFRHYPELDKK